LNEHDSAVLHPRPSDAALWSERFPVGPALADLAQTHWRAGWNLDAPRDVRVLATPAVHVALEPGNSRVIGPLTRPFVRTLTGRGQVFGTVFKAGAFGAFADVADLTDREVPLHRVLPWADALVNAPRTPEGLDHVLEAHRRPLHPTARWTMAAAQRIQADPDLLCVEQLATKGRSVRWVQRAFKRHVGVSAKWMIRCARLQQAVSALNADPVQRLTDLSYALGYADQAHFSRDFKAVVGETPSAYAARVQPPAAASVHGAQGASP
jgi:AraC-like DNA-binding protein